MKIHIVKKGDTLWEIANKYDVNFEQLKELNSQLSSPDMIMPGMKIKVPSSAKPVKKEEMQIKEKEKEMVKTPYKDISPKPLPVIKEDEKEKPKMNQKPPMHQMPIMDQDMYQYTTINFSQTPPENKEVKHHEKMQHMPQHMPMVPMCCYPMHPTMNQPMHQNNQPMNQQMYQMNQPMNQQMHQMNQPMNQPMNHPMNNGQISPMHMPPQKPIPPKPCGCGGEKPPFQNYAMMNMYDDVPEMEMPKKPEHKIDNMNNNHHYGAYNQPFPRTDTNQDFGNGNPYPTPPGFQPFPTASFNDDEDENNNE